MKKGYLILLSFCSLPFFCFGAENKASIDCYPTCTKSQIATAKREINAELTFLDSKHSRLQSKANLLENDIAMIRFNQRRSQIGSSVKSTTIVGGSNNLPVQNSREELDRLSDRLDELKTEMFSIEKEKNSMSAYLDQLSNLVPTKPVPQRASRSVDYDPYSERPDRSLSDADFYYNDDDELVLNFGDFYALLVGVNEYESDEIVDLDEPVQDAKTLKKVLLSNYEFTEEKTVLLENPTRSTLLDSLENLAGSIKSNDSLLIFYAGHGYWDEKFKQGYWLPADARQKTKASWISNATIRDYIYGIKTKHTLLIADACFSGGLFRTRGAFQGEEKLKSTLFQMTSRKAITSGTLTEVPDDSVFMKYLLQNLESNQSRYLTSQDLFAKFKIAVLNNSPLNQVPQHGVVQGSGDEGGDFIFVRKKNT